MTPREAGIQAFYADESTTNTLQGLNAAFDAYEAAAKPRIKALEWGDHEIHGGHDLAVAVAGFSHRYQVQRDPWGPGFVAYLHPVLPITDSTLWWQSKSHDTLEAAKAAAQADYEARIRSALVPASSRAEEG